MRRKASIFLMVLLMATRGFGQSLSRLKPITMSSQFAEWVGSRAVDGNYSRDNPNSCNCCAATSIANNLVDQWMEIDLGQTNTFTRIVLHGRNDEPDSQSLVDLAIYLDGSDVSIASIEDTGQGFVNFYHFDLGRTYSAQHIKFVLKGNAKVLVICEVDVLNDSIISKGATADESSMYSNWAASRALDGNTGPPDSCGCCSGTNLETDPWLSIDLGARFFITYIKIQGRTDWTDLTQSFGGMTVAVDGSIIDTVPTSETFISYNETFPTPEKIGQTVKFTLVGQNKLLVMCEVVIYGERVISINKQAQMSSRWFSDVASRSVDGDYRTLPGTCHCCASTNRETDPWLRVDLGNVHNISRIVIYGRTDSYYYWQTFVDMEIHLDGTRAHKTPTASEWVNFYQFQLSSVHRASSVTLTLVGYSKQLFVCELLLYGDCNDGFYGANCETQCHCSGEHCPTITGICPSGTCTPGYRTRTCSENCEVNRYGQDCAMSCGHCKDGHICNHITGHCNDCAPGYYKTDPFCKTACTPGWYGNNCAETCGHCRQGRPCDFVSGRCIDCEDGYKPSDILCKTACDSGTYGTNCNETCGNCRNNGICNTMDGHCTECMDGYMETDETCKTRCPSGLYGRNCVNKCGSCINNTPCDHVSGRCDQCMNGTYVFNDRLCNKTCVTHTYGYNCTDRCGNCKDNVTCDRVDGTCGTCDDGYDNTDSRCNTVCSWGSYGVNCIHTCGFCFNNDTCHHVNGSCSECAARYQGVTCTEMRLGGTPKEDEEEDSNTGILIGTIVPVIVIIVIVTIVLVVVLRRRRLNRKPRETETNSKSLHANNAYSANDVLVETNNHQTPQKHSRVPAVEESEYYNFVITTPGIAIHKLWDYIAINKENEGEGFAAEFKKLKDGLIFPYNDAMANRKKNRYREMYPYDHSRVHLKVERDGESEFINATHIDGYERKGKFIASQGPVDAMIDDFWRMVWQQNTKKIVMLTNLVEAGNCKCLQYWPDKGESIDFERINITLVMEEDVSDYSVRTLDVSQDNGPPRRIKQYHYKAWPDKDVPDSTWSLVQFWRKVFEDDDADKRPVIVHCSAGVGRTGTFIAMDNLYHQAIATGSVIPFSIVETLRNQRIKMVQTSDQYGFLHEAVADCLLFGTHFIWKSQFFDYYDFMINKDKASGKIRLKQQFEYLQKNIEDRKSARENEGTANSKNKTLTKEIDEYKPKDITRSTVETGKLDVVLLPSLGGSDSFILTAIPDKTTLTECWRLIDDNNVRTVITVVGDTRSNSSIWKSMSKQTCERYSPVLTADSKVDSILERTFTYSKQTKTKSKKQDAEIKQMELSLSTTVDPTTQADSLSTLLDSVITWHSHISTKEPVVIQCGDGMTEGATIAVLLNEKLRILKNGGQINITESVIQLRHANAACISSYKEYRFIHDIMLHVLEEKESEYAEAGDTGGQANIDGDIYQNV